MIKSYDVAILGLGTMGSYAALEVARRGYSVIGFDRFAPPHGFGSHGGESRIYRTAYTEGSNYVPLVIAAGRLWDELGVRQGTTLLHRTGMLHMGPAEGAFIGEVADCASKNSLAIARLSAEEVRRRYPAFQIADSYVGMFDPQAGWIDVHAALTGSLAEAERAGATLRLNTPVLGWSSESAASSAAVTLRTADAEYSAEKLIIAGGAWTHSLMRDLNLPLTVRRKVLTWFQPGLPELFAEGRIPVFAFPENWIYGFPDINGSGVKLAEHLGGIDLSGPDAEMAQPGPEDIDPIRATLAKYMPGLAGADGGEARLLRAKVCLYTLTPDEDFIVARHPGHENVVFAAGFSGHGFKFAPLIGQALADLAISGSTAIDIGFLGLGRFQPAMEH